MKMRMRMRTTKSEWRGAAWRGAAYCVVSCRESSDAVLPCCRVAMLPCCYAAMAPVLTNLSDSDDEDETAALMLELAKIKQERAEEKARLVSGHGSRQSASCSDSRKSGSIRTITGSASCANTLGGGSPSPILPSPTFQS